jgi:ferredoxin
MAERGFAMRLITKTAVVDGKQCNGCETCIRVCPVVAITAQTIEGKRVAKVDQALCQACGICTTRCPRHAVVLEERCAPMQVGLDGSAIAGEGRVAEICRKAHMYPDQVICYCHRIQAKEIAAAILAGADTPEEVARVTGARTGCGVLCITGVIRLLKAADIELKQAPGYQWYGKMATIWEIPEKVMAKYGKQYYLAEDRKKMNELFPGGEKE